MLHGGIKMAMAIGFCGRKSIEGFRLSQYIHRIAIRVVDVADTGAKVNSFADRLMAFDKNKNGKVEKDELPIRMQRVMENLDKNKNDILDASELEELKSAASEASSSGERNRQPAGGGRGGPPGGGGRRGPGGGRGGPPGGGVDQMIDCAFEYDKDGDGKLGREELTAFANAMQPPRGGRGGPPGGGHGGR